jgi:uncharacterized protein (DUF305 family)
MRVFALVGAAVAIAGLGACSQSEESEQNAATPMEQASPMAGGQTMMNDEEMDRQMAAMTGPFAESERDMHRAMRTAVGVDVADTWTRKMIAHHEGAIEMSRAFLAQEGGREDARAMAQQVIDKQTKEVAELRSLLKDGEGQPASAQPYFSAERDMMHAMMNARRDDVTESFLAKMLEHHRGGVALSEVVIAEGKDEQILAKARKTRDDQAKEAAETEEMLGA